MAFLGIAELRRLGLSGGLGEMPPAAFESRARSVLQLIASSMDDVVTGIDSHSRPQINGAMTTLQYMDDGSSSGWLEGRTSKNEALATLRSLIGEADRAEPGWVDSYVFGAPSRQVEAFRAGAVEVATRMRNRAASSDFDKAALTVKELQARGVDPSTYRGAVITGADASLIDLTTSAWGRKVTEDEANARKAQCNFTTVFTGEQTWVQYIEGCWNVPWWGKYAAVPVLLGLAYAVARGARGR